VTYTKDPNAVLDYVLDWTKWLNGDTIATSTWIVPPGLTLNSHTNTTTRSTAWISGGSAGQSYTVTNRITTLGGRTEDRSFIIAVAER
jgi:hypothetical protein